MPTLINIQEPLFIGIDGGGSRCRARLADATGVCLGEGVAGPANTRLGLDQVFKEILVASHAALASAGLAATTIHHLRAGLGLAGLVSVDEGNAVRAYPHPFATMVVDSDAYIACLGAHAGDDGAILILGTGSCGCGVVQGHRFNLGGWGFRVGDHGGGALLGQAAIRQALLAHEQLIEATAFSRAVLAHFDQRPDHIVLWADTATPADYAVFAPLVFEYAAQADALALDLVAESVAGAVLLIRGLVAQGASSVALLGGVAEPLTAYLPAEVRAVLTAPVGDALEGALWLARRAYGLE